jgi:hypothetical protein
MGLGPAQVHSQQHLGPVLCLGAAGARLDVEECVAGVEFAGKHSPKLETANLLFVLGEIGRQLISGLLVFFRNGEFQEFRCIAEPALEPVEDVDDVFQL